MQQEKEEGRKEQNMSFADILRKVKCDLEMKQIEVFATSELCKANMKNEADILIK